MKLAYTPLYILQGAKYKYKAVGQVLNPGCHTLPQIEGYLVNRGSPIRGDNGNTNDTNVGPPLSEPTGPPVRDYGIVYVYIILNNIIVHQ